jgi:hypothetical protein
VDFQSRIKNKEAIIMYRFGSEYVKPSWLNANYGAALRLGLFNLIRQLQAGAVVFSKGGKDAWGEAYVDADGRNNSVAAGTTAIHSANKYIPTITPSASADTLHDPDSFTNPNNAFNFDYSNYANKSGSGGARTIYLGKTFSAKTITNVFIKSYIDGSIAGSTTFSMTLQSYNGATWSDETVLYTTVASNADYTYSGVVALNKSVQGLRVKFVTYGTSNPKLYVLDYGAPITGKIVHAIPSGTFAANISSAIGAVLFADIEAGASARFKLTNASEDSGWIDCNNPLPTNFTAFTSEPTFLTLELSPKVSSPTAGMPSALGVAIMADTEV